jgi:hypothetical protein
MTHTETETIHVRAHHRSVKYLGEWTTARRFDVRASRGLVDDGDLRRVGRGRVKDWTGASAPDGRRIRLAGEMRNAELRVHRGGVAILSLLRSRRSRSAIRKAHREGRLGQPA